MKRKIDFSNLAEIWKQTKGKNNEEAEKEQKESGEKNKEAKEENQNA